MTTEFDWDPLKAASNLRKHGVAFEDAVLVFDDPYVIVEQDRIEAGERRWQAIGRVAWSRVVVVAHAVLDEADGTEIIRIISARKAERRERERYDDQVRPV